MKSSIGIVTKRQEKLIQYLKEKGSIQVDDASKMFNVSPLTIRRDTPKLRRKRPGRKVLRWSHIDSGCTRRRSDISSI